MRLFVVLLGWLGLTQLSLANVVEYYGTPVFYGKYSPNELSCSYDPKARYGYCGSNNLPEVAEVGLTRLDDPTKAEGVEIPLHTELVCSKGECKSNYGEPLGTSQDPQVSYWDIPTGYYLVVDATGSKAFKHGTGPRRDLYPMKRVKVLPAYDDPPVGVAEHNNDGVERYDVYCNASGECSYMGRVMMASELKRYIPMVLTVWCSKVFCYYKDGGIAGLNPKDYNTVIGAQPPIVVSKGLTQAELNLK